MSKANILVVNPNSTASMTRKIDQVAQRCKAPDSSVTSINPVDTPSSIEGHYDEAMCLRGLLDEVRKGQADGYDGFVVACFDDPGVAACRELARGPVVGICEAAMHAASMIATRFSVVTTLPRTIPIIESLAYQYGMERKLARVRAAAIPVLELENSGVDVREKIRVEMVRALQQDGAEAVILGCAGMADLADSLSEELGVPVIDGVVAAVKLIEALIGGRFKTSKIGAYALPREKGLADASL